MSVKIRLALRGKKHQLSYRVVAQDTRSKRDGNFLEFLGFLNPNEKEKKQHFLDHDRVKFWIKRGATFTPTAKYVFEKGQLPPKPKNKKKEAKKAQDATAALAATQASATAENAPESPAQPSQSTESAPTGAKLESTPDESGKAESAPIEAPQGPEKTEGAREDTEPKA